jgi:hypothetical protein
MLHRQLCRPTQESLDLPLLAQQETWWSIDLPNGRSSSNSSALFFPVFDGNHLPYLVFIKSNAIHRFTLSPAHRIVHGRTFRHSPLIFRRCSVDKNSVISVSHHRLAIVGF